MVSSKKRQQHSLKILRRFDEDIFGRLAVARKATRVLNYLFDAYQNNYKYKKLLRSRSFFLSKKRGKFVYKVVSEEKEFKRRKRTMKKFNYLLLLKLRRFYGLGKHKFKRVFFQRGVSTNILGKSFAYFLESRLDVILYRANFFPSIYAARQYINHKKVYVNGALVSKPGVKIFLNDIITVLNYKEIYLDLKRRLENNEILVNFPAYLEVDYKLGAIILTKMPQNNEVPFPFFMNLNNIIHSFLK